MEICLLFLLLASCRFGPSEIAWNRLHTQYVFLPITLTSIKLLLLLLLLSSLHFFLLLFSSHLALKRSFAEKKEGKSNSTNNNVLSLSNFVVAAAQLLWTMRYAAACYDSKQQKVARKF